MKIAIIGTHGTGKTTLAYEIATEAKRRKKNAMVINEIARKCPFTLNEGFGLEGAIWIATSQINMELSALSEGYELIICDRSAYDPICYLKATNVPRNEYEKLEAFTSEWIKTYDKIIFVLPSGMDLISDGVRSTDIHYQEDIHKQFFEFCRTKKDIIYIDSKKIFLKDLSNLFESIL